MGLTWKNMKYFSQGLCISHSPYKIFLECSFDKLLLASCTCRIENKNLSVVKCSQCSVKSPKYSNFDDKLSPLTSTEYN